jgi:hypothetical protein
MRAAGEHREIALGLLNLESDGVIPRKATPVLAFGESLGFL